MIRTEAQQEVYDPFPEAYIMTTWPHYVFAKLKGHVLGARILPASRMGVGHDTLFLVVQFENGGHDVVPVSCTSANPEHINEKFVFVKKKCCL